MEDIEHFAIILGVFATSFGLLKGLRGWRVARDEAMAARIRQDDVLKEIAAEFKPRNGRTLAHTVADMDLNLKDHCAKAAVWFADNAAAHEEIKKAHDTNLSETNRRIDGLFEMLGGSTTPRKAAERHHYREGASGE